MSEVDVVAAFRRDTSLEVKASTARGPRTFRSAVRYMDVDDMWIQSPDEESGVEGVAIGSDLSVTAEMERYRYTAKVQLKEFVSFPYPLWRVDRPREIERGQGRGLTRQPVRLKDCSLMVEHEGRDDIEPLEFIVEVVDLSVGGCQFESLVEILEGKGLVHTLMLPLTHLDEPIEGRVELLGSKRVETASKKALVYRARFFKPPARLAGEITRFINLLELDSRPSSQSSRSRVREEPYPMDMALKALRIGGRLTIECFDAMGNQEAFFTTLQDVTPTGLSILAPTYRGGPVAIDASKEIRAVFFHDRANVLVVAHSKRIGVVREPVFLWKLAMPTEFFQRHQRSHVRLRVTVDAVLLIIDPSAQPPVDKSQEVILTDISAGGAGFQSPERLPAGPDATVEITFELEGVRSPFEVRVGLVGDLEERRLTDRPVFMYKCQFMNISERRQDEITKYIFEQQREQRKRGIA